MMVHDNRVCMIRYGSYSCPRNEHAFGETLNSITDSRAILWYTTFAPADSTMFQDFGFGWVFV